MQRAAVLIGVSKSGTLPVLPAVLPSVKAMSKWAHDQGMRTDLVITLTDESGPLGPGAIKTAIRQVIDLAIVDQLIVYFAGHGVNIRYGEYWLLSDAPGDTQAAVNVSGSVELARFCGIPHVIFFSDACRTAPEGIQAQYVSGSEIFPNNGPDGLENSVDLFFACTLGRPAHEVKDPTSSASAFKAIYTEALVSALTGQRIEIVVPEDSPPDTAPGPKTGLVRPRKLKEHLRREVVEKFRLAGTTGAVYQEPDGRITSEENAWVSRVPLPLPRSSSLYLNDRASVSIPSTLQDVSTRVLQAVLYPPSEGESAVTSPPARVLKAVLHPPSEGESPVTSPPTRELAELIHHVRATPGACQFGRLIHDNVQAFGPDNYETDCGFKIRGTGCVEAFAVRFGTELLRDKPDLQEQLVRVDTSLNALGDGLQPRVDNVLLTFGDGTSVVLPAIPEFLATVSVEDGEVTDVRYEPSTSSSRWPMYRDQKDDLRLLRSVVGSAANLGVFALSGADAPTLARRMQVAKGVDPTMSLYAAYAYRDLGARSRIREMHKALQADLGFSLFDVAMLANEPIRNTDLLPNGGTSPAVVPFVPLLSLGWSLLNAHNVQLPASLGGLTPHLHQSLWTAFDAAGASIIRTAMELEAQT